MIKLFSPGVVKKSVKHFTCADFNNSGDTHPLILVNAIPGKTIQPISIVYEQQGMITPFNVVIVAELIFILNASLQIVSLFLDGVDNTKAMLDCSTFNDGSSISSFPLCDGLSFITYLSNSESAGSASTEYPITITTHYLLV